MNLVDVQACAKKNRCDGSEMEFFPSGYGELPDVQAFMGYGNLTAEYSLSLVRRSLKQNLLNINAVQARRKILIAACRNGMFYALDAGTGQRIWARIIQRGMSLVAMDTYTSINSTSADIQV